MSFGIVSLAIESIRELEQLSVISKALCFSYWLVEVDDSVNHAVEIDFSFTINPTRTQ